MARQHEAATWVPEYVAIGHATRDVTPAGLQAGGSVSFASRMAQACGLRAAVVTSAAPDYDVAATLPGIALTLVPAAATTTFANIETPNGREQRLYERAASLPEDSVPVAWRRTRIVHLAPLVNEIDASLAALFPDSFVGVTPQGWMREWDASGRVTACALRNAADLLPHADAVILSTEDLPDSAELDRLRALASLLIVTRGGDGCTIYQAGGEVDIPAPVVEPVNLVGAGDIFAATFFVEMQRTQDPVASAETATRFASHSVEGATLDEKAAIIRALIESEPAE